MQRARLDPSHGHRVQILTFAVVLLTVSLLPMPWVAPASAATLDRVRETGKLTLGYRTDARPFSYQDESGNPDGYAVILCKQLADGLKSEFGLSDLAVEWVPVTTEDQFKAVQENKVDLLCGAAETLTARKEVDFSVPIFPGGIGALLRVNAPVGLKEVLSGQPPSGPLWRGFPAQILEKQVFSVVAGTPTEKWLASQIDKFQLTANVVPVKGYEEGIRGVLDGSTDVFFADRSILLDAAKRSPSADDLLVLDRQFTFGPIALALERGDADFRLLVDQALGKLFGSQEFHRSYVKWFGQPGAEADMFFKLSTLPE